MTNATDIAAPTQTHSLVYTGRTGELFALFGVNLVLMIVTLGVYRFWAKVRIRRYLWSHTMFQGEPFGYTGSGKELFKGFIKILFMLILPLALVWQAITMLTAAAIEGVSLIGFITLLSPFIVFWVRRYRLSRTDWRGIRFQQAGEATTYARKAIKGWFLNLFTLFFYVPYNVINLLDYQINRVHFGTMPFRYTGTISDLGPGYRRIWWAVLLLGLLSFVSLVGCGIFVFAALRASHLKGLGDIYKDPRTLIFIILSALLFYGFFLVAALVRLKYRLLIYRHVARSTQLGAMTAQFTATFWQFFRLTVGNFLLKAISLGLLSPIATHRRMKFLCRHLKLQGLPDFAAVKQVAAFGQAGEGWTQWLDVDALDF
jgi:uncharacterized membrane protein YjgN (DUF898 family)